MPGNPDLDRLREVLNDAAVLCGRVSSAVSFADLPHKCAGAVAATRNAVLAAQQAASVAEQIRAWDQPSEEMQRYLDRQKA